MTEKTVTTTEVVEPKTTHIVLDNSDIEAVLADARGEPRPVKEEKPEVKTEIKTESVEDDNGLTEEQRNIFTENMKKTIGKKHRMQKEAEEFAETQFNEKQLAIKRADALERENNRLKEQLTPTKVEEEKEPDRANFKDDKSYADAMIDYRVEQKLKEREAKDHAKALEDHNREMIAEAHSRIDKAKELVPDWEEVVGATDTPVPDAIAGYMQESEMIAELGYFFGKNPQELEKLAKLSPGKQLVAIGKIESTLKPFSEKSEKDKSNATTASQDGKAIADPSTNAKASKARPEPIKPLDTGSASQVTKPESEMTYQETRALWEKTNKVNLRARSRH